MSKVSELSMLALELKKCGEALIGISEGLADMFGGAEEEKQPAKKAAAKKRSGDMFQRLLTAGQRLISVIRKNEGLSNKDTAKFTDQIQALCDKWDRP